MISYIAPCNIACIIHVKNVFETLLLEKLQNYIHIIMCSKLCCNISVFKHFKRKCYKLMVNFLDAVYV